MKSLGYWTEKSWSFLFPLEKITFIGILLLHVAAYIYLYFTPEVDWYTVLYAFLLLVSSITYVMYVDRFCKKRFENRQWHLEHKRG